MQKTCCGATAIQEKHINDVIFINIWLITFIMIFTKYDLTDAR